MKKIFEKHETLFCILLIVVYVVVNSYCIQNFGIEDYRSTIINTIFSIVLIIFMIILKTISYYGLKKVTKLKQYLYFIPLLLIVSVNLWNGININNSANEIIFYILTMINVGFIEEIIFRGFLFKMMAKDNIKSAIIVSSVTFGIGHIINLLNGADLIPTLMQICYAISIGYLFVIIFYKSKSLIPCIITHSLVNSLSIFNIDNYNVFASASISGFNDSKEIFFENGKKYVGPLMYLGKPLVNVYINNKFKEFANYTAVDGINKVNIPFFIANSKNDSIVSYLSSIAYQKDNITNPNVTYYIVNDYDHFSILHSNDAINYQSKVNNELKNINSKDFVITLEINADLSAQLMLIY